MKSIHKDLRATFFNQLTKIFLGPMLLFFIPFYLNSVEQGYWFSFTSLAALVVFADLGFSNIVLQFAAHEFAFLNFNKQGEICGQIEHISKLSSFFKFCISWFIKISIIVFPIIMYFGYTILQQKGEVISWQIPWILYSSISIIVFLNSVVLSFFEGCNSVRTTQMIRMVMCLTNGLVTIIGLFWGYKLIVLAVSSCISSLLSLYFIYNKFYNSIIQLIKFKDSLKYNWYQQFLPLIIRYGISWCSGYFIFQMFTPLAFKYYGPDFAGKIGLSLSLWSAGMAFSISWITSITPLINMYVAEKKWKQLDTLFNTYIIRTCLTFVFGGVLYFIVFALFHDKIFIFDRIVSLETMFILFLTSFMQLIVSSMAVYLRAHKREPMLVLSVFSACYVCVSTFILANYSDYEFFFLGYFTSYFFVLPVTYKLLCQQRQMHSN